MRNNFVFMTPISNEKYLVLFSLFCCALLLHFQRLIWERPLVMCFLFVLGIVQFINFRWIWSGVGIMLLSLYVLLPDFPRSKNHANLEVIFSIVILLILFFKIIKPRLTLPSHLASILFRIILVSVYFFSGFHKLNTAFFDISTSCSRHIYDEIILVFDAKHLSTSPFVLVTFQYLTIFIELILPFGIFFRKTRLLTAWILVFFHIYLCLLSLVNFSSLSFFWIAGSVINLENKPLSITQKNAFKAYYFCVLLLLVSNLILNFIIPSKIVFSLSSLIFSTGALIFSIHFFKKNKLQKLEYKKSYTAFLIVLFLGISFWSMRGYFGLGNTGNLTMYSNLTTEKSQSNHLLIDTKKTKIWNFEEDNVLVLKISDTLNTDLENFRLPVSEFKYQAKKWCDDKKFKNGNLSCILVYKNDTLKIKNLRNSEWSKPLWWHRYLYFRKIQTEQGMNKCRW